MKKPNIIFWDLETLPNLMKFAERIPSLGNWPGRTLKGNINSIICFGYKRLGDKKARCVSAWDFPKNWKKDVNDDLEVVKAAYNILKDADGIVTHNGKRFDLKFLQARLRIHKLPPLPKINHIDTKAVSSRELFMYSNSLNELAKDLGLETKLENGGWNLWVKVLKREVASQKLMTKYCKQDVEVLEQLFLELRPLIKNIPNYRLFTNEAIDAKICTNCGSFRVAKNGTRTTKTSRQQRYTCSDCGSNMYENKRGELKYEG